VTASDWKELARLDDLRAVLDRADSTGAKNRLVDAIHRRALAAAVPAGRGVGLDFGCGVGRLTGWLAERSDHVVGLEVTPDMLRVARRRVGSAGVSWVLFDGERIPLAAGSVQRIVSVYVLQHILAGDSLNALVREFARVTADGGRVALIEQIRQDQPKQIDGFLEQRLVSTYSEAFLSAGFRATGSSPIRVPSRATTALSRLRVPGPLLLRLSDLSLALGRRRLGHRSADFLLTFAKPVG
jgi:ubiquinone/menaquinone biosynthesis C-methylase UbiE